MLPDLENWLVNESLITEAHMLSGTLFPDESSSDIVLLVVGLIICQNFLGLVFSVSGSVLVK